MLKQSVTFYKVFILSVIFFLVAGMPAFAQVAIDIGFDVLGIDDGLSTDKVFDVKQDKQGFIWIATYNGLDRYDGTNIVNYFTSPGDSTSIPSSWVREIIIDKEDNVWITTISGNLAKYNRTYDNFKNYTFNPAISILDAFEGNDDKIWLATFENGLFYFDKKKETLQPIQIEGYENRSIFKICEADEHLLLDYGDPSFILKYNPETTTQSIIRISDVSANKTVDLYGKSIYQETSGILWVGTIGHGLYRKEKDKTDIFSVENGLLSGNIITSILDYDEQYLWVSTDGGGITVIDKLSKEVRFLQSDHENPYSLSLNNTISLFKDRQGIVWVGTFGGGINLYDPTKYKFNKVVANPHQPEALSNDFTLCFLEDSDGDIWIGTDGGGLNMVTQDNKHIHFQHDGNEGNNRNAISGNVITSLAEDINEKIWIATFGAGISIYDKKNKKFTRHNTNSNHGLQHNTAWTIIRDREDYMWIGFETGAIAKYNANTDHYEYVKKDSTRETISFIRYLFEDHAGNLWCAMMNNGLWLVDKEKMTMKQVDLQELNYFSISHIMEDSQHRIWMGSERFGLINLIPDNNGQATFEVMPLSNDSTNIISVRGIVEDNQGELWLSSDKGVFQFNPDTRQSHQFTLADGLQSNQFSFSASMKTKNGLIYLGGPKGYNFFNPENIEIKQTAQNVMITNLFLFDQAVSITSGGILRKNILETQEIVLDYTQSTLGFEFSELNFSRNKEKRYCYMLEGMDDSWLTNRPESNVRYTNLSPGEYTFLVRPTANGACLSEKGVTLSIIILPPWWETWWFKLAAILITGLLVVLLFQFRLKMIKESNRKLERIVNERTEELLTINNQLSENNEKLLLAQNQLYASEKMASLGNLMAGIAHEINNPMNFIKGGMEALDENRMELAEYLNQVEKAGLKDNDITYNPLQNLELIKRVSININNGIKRILFIIDGLRVFTRSGKDQTEKVNIHQNIDATLIILEHSYRHVASVNTDYGKLPYIHCNPGKLNQAFSNLISNSIHAIEEKVEIDPGYRGVILIRTSYNEENEQVHLSFYDNGPGVPDQVMKNLYEPFVTTKAQGKGTGLGLSLTYSIIAEHQGEIKYSREMISNNGKEEEFTLFDISLPIG